MDITPQLLKEVKFSESWRGYDRDEVDEFLERVGAGVALVQGRLREAVERAESAESRAQSQGGRSEAEETLKRTLVLAQRTADAAVAEANETAQRTVAEAEARAQRTIADADAHAQRTIGEAEAQSTVLRAEAEAEARRVIESTRAPLLEEIAELERVRNFLRDDIALLEGHLDAQRERLRAQINQLSSLLDEPDMLRADATPETSGVEPEAELANRVELLPPVAVEAPVSGQTPEVAAAPVQDFAPPAVSPAPQAPEWHEAPADEPTGFHSTDTVDPWGGPSSSGSTSTGSLSAGTSSSSVWDDHGPATQPVQSLAELETGGDSFLDQLRRAVDDELEDDGAMTAFFDQDDDDRPKSRFGRRR
jgi:DivIVA domain-containing protein